MQKKQTNGIAVGSLILGILSITCFGIIAGIPAIIMGHLALRSIKSEPQKYQGSGLAISGLIAGYISLVLLLLFIVILIIVPSPPTSSVTSSKQTNVKKQVAPVDKPTTTVNAVLIGEWNGNENFPGLITLVKSDDQIFMTRKYLDGSEGTDEMYIQCVGSQTRFRIVGRDSTDYMIIKKNGDLELGDSDGIWNSLRMKKRGFVSSREIRALGTEQFEQQSRHTEIDINPRELIQGLNYTVSKKTPLMPEFNPQYPQEAMRQMKHIPPNGSITILSKKLRASGVPWYEVRAFDNRKQFIGNGWVNSTALRNQNLRIIE